MASGEMSQAEFTSFLTQVFEQLSAFSVDGSIHMHAWTGVTCAKCSPPATPSMTS